MKNKLSDLNNHLFAQLERLSDEALTAEQIGQEVERAQAIVSVSDQIIGTAALQFKAAELVARHGRGVSDMIPTALTSRQIEHRPEERAPTADELEAAAIKARRQERARQDEAAERRRQECEDAT